MKKVIIILFIISLILIVSTNNEDILIPNDAIRFRVIANSNSVYDIKEKMVIKDNLEKEIYELIKNETTKDGVKNILNNNIDKIKEIIDKYNIQYKIDYGLNYFPNKNYKGVIYPAGDYESLVITLGEGLGDNFWCVLFPPLCLLDNDKDYSDVKYKFYVQELLDKF